jgi:propionyl-CoA synthetase
MTTIWNDDARFLSSYFSHFKELLYSSLDWAIRDEQGYTFILGRTDDVINVAGHRLGTREIEESVSGFPAVAEAAVIGVNDELKGQVPVVFATLRQATEEPHERVRAAEGMRRTVEQSLGAVARPARVYIVNALPKTRSGKLLRRSLQALAQGADPGDLSTLDDPNALEEVRKALQRGPEAGN